LSVFIIDEFDATKVQTHVLVIGVNSYPYLKGGDLSGSGIATHMGLEQLAAPVQSASEITDLFERSYNNAGAPIGSIQILVSTKKYTSSKLNKTFDVEEPTIANISAAFKEWVKRLDTNQHNVAILYYCGHGIEPSALLLLPQDFGADPLRPWSNAINLTATYANMAQINARTQVFLIDACRGSAVEADDAALTQARAIGSLGQALLDPMGRKYHQDRAAPLITSAPAGQRAYGPANGIESSLFARAAIDCFQRAGADRQDNGTKEWIVTTESIGGRMRDRLSRLKHPNGASAVCEIGGTSTRSVELHRFGGRAAVLFHVTTIPKTALGEATLVLSDSIDPPRTRPPAPEPWEDELLTGDSWELHVKLPPTASWKTKVLRQLTVYPPIFLASVPLP
jgi:hypothetical protein